MFFLDSLGSQRYWLIGFLLLVVVPIGAGLRLFARPAHVALLEPIIPVSSVVVANIVIPGHWHTAIALALILALAPGYNRKEESYLTYVWLGLFLFTGFAISGWMQKVDDFEVTLLPSMFLYAVVVHHMRWEGTRALQRDSKSAAVRSLTQIMGGIAHDINNTLTSALGHADLALTRKNVPQDARTDLELAATSILAAADISCGLMGFAGGAPTNAVERLQLKEELRLVIGMIRPWAAPNVKIEFDEGDSQTTVEAVRKDIQQMLLNVLINAVESMSDVWGSVTIKLFSSDEYVMIFISDEGAGISESLLQQVFEPYFTTKPDGHGFGLAQAKRTASASGGGIQLRPNSNGIGTTVEIKFPIFPRLESEPEN